MGTLTSQVIYLQQGHTDQPDRTPDIGWVERVSFPTPIPPTLHHIPHSHFYSGCVPVLSKLIKTGLWGGGALPYLKVVGNFPGMNPLFWHLAIPLGPLLCLNQSHRHLPSAEKNGLSLSRLVPEIICSEMGLIIHQHLSFDHFEVFYNNFL